MTRPSLSPCFPDEIVPEALIARLRALLESELSGVQIALLHLDPLQSQVWRVVWSSRGEFEVRASQTQVPEKDLDFQWRPFERAEFQGALGVRLEPVVSRLALVLQSSEPLKDQELSLLQSQACLGIYESREEAWRKAAVGLLGLLPKQRVAIGHHLHRGPAQGLTAARLEFSLLEPDILPLLGPIRRAVEDAGEGLREIVHERLAPPAQGAQRQLEEEDPERLLGILEQEALALGSWLLPAEMSRAKVGEAENSKDGAKVHSGALDTQERALAHLWALGGGMLQWQENNVYRLLKF